MITFALMKKKPLNHFSGLVYSTNSEAMKQEEETVITPEPSEQKLRVSLDRKRRKGKTVTLIEGFVGHEDDLKEFGKWLKTKCGTGGSAKDEEILIQGDYLQRVKELLKEKGYGLLK